MSISTNIAKLTKLQKEYQEELKKVGAVIATEIGESFKSLCEKVPTIKRMGWSQFTPYFNDGEPCRFGTNGCSIAFSESVKDDSLAYQEDDINEDGNIEQLYSMPSEEELINDDGKYTKERNEAILKHLSLEQRGAIREFFDMMSGLSDDLLENSFGEGLIVYSADGSYEEEYYEHD